MKYIKKFKTNKTLATLLILTIISFILGILFIAILDDSNKVIITKSITNFFKCISKNNLNYQNAITTSLLNNIIVNLLVWILGISIIGLPIVTMIQMIKTFILSFSMTSIIYTYSLKGIIPCIIYIIPHIINLFITFVMVYYSINFSVLLWNYLFRKKDYNRKVIVKRYLKVLIFTTVTLIISSLIEIFLIPSILKFLIG